MTDKRFANWFNLQLNRPQRRWTKAEFSRRANVPFSTVQAWSSGRSVPSAKYCDVISDVFAIDLDLVLWQAGHRPNIDVIDPDDPSTTIISLTKRVNWKKDAGFLVRVPGKGLDWYHYHRVTDTRRRASDRTNQPETEHTDTQGNGGTCVKVAPYSRHR